jgi:hypothetical protein
MSSTLSPLRFIKQSLRSPTARELLGSFDSALTMTLLVVERFLSFDCMRNLSRRWIALDRRQKLSC